MTNRLILESTPAEQAKQMGLVYLGFGGWGYADDPNRKVVARTIDGKLVKVGEEEEGESTRDLGRITILAFEDTILKADPTKPSRYIEKFHTMIKAIVKRGNDFVLLCELGSERALADYLRRIGLKAGLKIVPIGEMTPAKAHDFVEKKIQEGYSTIEYFDTDEHNCKAVESLKATFNKKENLTIDVHPLTRMDSASAPPKPGHAPFKPKFVPQPKEKEATV